VLVILAYVGAELKTPMYTAKVKMYVKGKKITTADFYSGIYAGDMVQEHAELIRSKIVLNRVVDALKLYEIPDDRERKYATPLKKWIIDYRNKKSSKAKHNSDISPDQDKEIKFQSALNRLTSQIGVRPTKGANLFYVTVADFNPGLAKKIANSLSRSYIIFDLEQQVEELKLKFGKKHTMVLQLKRYISEFQETLSGDLIPDLQAIGPASVKIVSQAEGASRSKEVNKPLLLLFSFLSGIFLAMVGGVIVDHFRATLKTPKDIARNLQLPFLGSIPKRKKRNELIMSDPHTGPDLSCIRAFQRLGDKLCLTVKEKNINTFLVTSFENFEDASAVIANLGIYLSRETGKKVLIIDANINNPTLHKTFKLKESDFRGLIELYEETVTFEDAVARIGKNLDVLFTKKADFRPIKLLDSSFMLNFINESKRKYDIIIIDCSANLRIDSEPIFISSFTDSTIIIINEGKDRLQDINLAVKALSHKNNKMIFTVLNNRNEDMPRILYKIS
jgi:Mrp family chromosome partitioning ATPase